MRRESLRGVKCWEMGKLEELLFICSKLMWKEKFSLAV